MDASVVYPLVPYVRPERSDDFQPRTTRASFADVRILQTCPVCGRRLRVLVEYLGSRVCCRHCRGTFTAREPSERKAADERSASQQRGNRWLAVSEAT